MYIILGFFGNNPDPWVYGQPNSGLPFPAMARARAEIEELKKTRPDGMKFTVAPLLRREPTYKVA